MSSRRRALHVSLAPKSVLRCAVYTRKSTAAGLEKDFNSLDAQWEACEAYVRSRALEGWTVLPEAYEDGGFTGANTDRPGVQRLLEEVRQGRVDVVVVYKVDRLSRSLMDFVQVMELLNRHGVAFVSVTQNFSTADAVGRLTLNILMSFAEFEREMIAERIRDKMAAARRKGKWTGGKPPLGYASVKGKLEVLPEEAGWAKQVFAWYLEGESLLGITERLNAARVPLKTAQKARALVWRKPHVHRILANRLYTGMMVCHGEWVPGEHAALIAPEAFEQVQRRLKSAAQVQKGTSRNPVYLIRGTLRCGLCGGLMTAVSTQTRGRQYRYYRCTTRTQQGTSACSARQFPAEALEGFVVERLKEALLQDGPVGEAGRAWVRALTGRAVEAGFEAMWSALTLVSRQRLVRLMVEEVVADERRGRLLMRLRDPRTLTAEAG